MLEHVWFLKVFIDNLYLVKEELIWLVIESVLHIIYCESTEC